MFLEVLVGFMVAAWLSTVGAVAYVSWRYVYLPWKVMRADLIAMREELRGVKSDIGLRKALTRDDTEVAITEARERARQAFIR